MTSNVFDNAQNSLSHAKKEVLDVLETEKVRHESALTIAMTLHEETLRTENEYHASRVAELEKIIAKLDERQKP